MELNTSETSFNDEMCVTRKKIRTDEDDSIQLKKVHAAEQEVYE
jgi:hypothetical protein